MKRWHHLAFGAVLLPLAAYCGGSALDAWAQVPPTFVCDGDSTGATWNCQRVFRATDNSPIANVQVPEPKPPAPARKVPCHMEIHYTAVGKMVAVWDADCNIVAVEQALAIELGDVEP